MNLFKRIKTWLNDYLLVINAVLGIDSYKKYKLSYSIDGMLRTVYSEEHRLFLDIRSECEIFEIIEGKEVFLRRRTTAAIYSLHQFYIKVE